MELIEIFVLIISESRDSQPEEDVNSTIHQVSGEEVLCAISEAFFLLVSYFCLNFVKM